ncbi:MAG: hypothetical protein H6739_21345 [Alphaproteobacteria bacterium]|nr:hypothetical protein [Alphaproteobacteria bacterium]
MTDLRNVHQKRVAVSGRFPDFSKAELEILLRARGAWQVTNTASKDTFAMLSAEATGKKPDKARELGVPILLPEDVRAALGAPLEGYRERLAFRIADRPNYYKNAVLHIGDPASDALIARIEERIGFPLPEAARNLYRQLDGISWLWTIPKLQDTVDAPLPWNEACHQDGELWRRLADLQKHNKSRFTMGLICIPPAETVFFEQWDGRMFSSDAYGPKDTVKVGTRKLKAKEFFRNLFIFDAFHGYYQAGLWADPEEQTFNIVYGSDYGADWTWCKPIPFEIYMEYLAWEFGSNRIIDLVAKLGRTTSMHRWHPRTWMQLEPYREL